jgi:DNA polymerase
MSVHDELRDLVSGFRQHLQWRARGGAVWAPAGTRAAGAAATDGADRAAIGGGGKAALLAQVRQDLGDCTRCKLHATRTHIVFGVGDPEAPLMFVGEAPGADEDRLGEPFVGKAGQLLDRMIAAMGWTRARVYIANVLKSRPPGNRDPEPDEVEACKPFLFRQIEAIDPTIIITLGRPAAHLLLDTQAPISRLRGRWQLWRDRLVMPTFHPAYLLRSPDKKREAWDDLQQVMARLAELGIEPPGAPKSAR